MVLIDRGRKEGKKIDSLVSISQNTKRTEAEAES